MNKYKQERLKWDREIKKLEKSEKICEILLMVFCPILIILLIAFALGSQ